MLTALCTAVLGTVTKYELHDYESKAADASTVVHGNARFTVLSPSLIRMEYDSDAKFEDRATLAFVNRKLDTPQFKVDTSSGLKITTSHVVLSYMPGSGNFATAKELSVAPTGPSTFSKWTYGQTSATDKGNLRGTFRTLDGRRNESVDCSNDKLLHCEWGLVSRTGWALVDDTGVPCFDEDDWWTDSSGKMLRNANDEDLYLFAHSHRYTEAIQDYVKVGGSIPIFPRNNHGVWFTRWYYYTNKDVMNTVDEYKKNGMPLDVLVLDMNWHKKDDWSGYSWDPDLFPYPSDTMDYIHRLGVTVAANLHDATGVGTWEDKYPALCAKLGYDPKQPPGPKGIPFTLTNKTYVEALEDIVVRPIEKSGMDFWWIDWQQGESAGGTGQDGKRLKMNPTIWTDKMRVTDPIRRCKQNGDCSNKRGVVHARWGGLGNHRYQHGFSGDVNGLTWANLAYQTYFSATAVNVGWGWWSHDIEGPGNDNEMYTRWIQVGSFSGIMRSHDRGMSAGGCHDSFPTLATDCSTVRPYDVPLEFRNANRDALVAREMLLPYIYTHTRVGYETGVGLLRPMYYHFPEEDNAYPRSMSENLGQEMTTRQYMFGSSILVAPVTAPSGCASPFGPVQEPCALTKQSVWVPPGTWYEWETGLFITGPTVLERSFALAEIPRYVIEGAVVPTIPVRLGDTVGLASRQYTELGFDVFLGNSTSGSFEVYEDDGKTYDYLKGAYSTITASYARSGSRFRMTVTTNGTFVGQPEMRKYSIKLVGEGVPKSVTATVDGKAQTLSFSRWGGAGSWSYDGWRTALVVELPEVRVSSTVLLAIDLGASVPAGLPGVFSRSQLAKRNLDETRSAPGHGTVDPKGAPLSHLAAMPEALAVAAGSDSARFASLVGSVESLLSGARAELKDMSGAAKSCSIGQGIDASAPVRTSKYPNGLSKVSQDDCCNACSGDAECSAFAYDPAARNCWPLRVVGGTHNEFDRVLGTSKSMTRGKYSYDLINTLPN